MTPFYPRWCTHFLMICVGQAVPPADEAKAERMEATAQ